MKYRLAIILCLILGGLVVTPGRVSAAGVVGTGTPASCTRNALSAALSGGGLVTFNCGSAPATISINALLDISVANTTIDGGGRITLQGVPGQLMIRHRTLANVPSTLTLRNLTISGASVSGPNADGGAIFSVNNSFSPPSYPQTLNIDTVTFINNIVNTTSASTGYPSDFGGGAIFTSGGYLNITNSVFTGNQAQHGAGGAIHVLRSNLSITSSVFSGNMTTPAVVPGNNSGFGGAIYIDGALSSGNGTISIQNSRFDSNAGYNEGGAIHVNLYGSDNESISVSRTSFNNNTINWNGSGPAPVVGTMGNGGAISGGGSNGPVGMTIADSTFNSNTAYGPSAGSGGGGGGSGGAVGLNQNTNLTIRNSTFYNNRGLAPANCAQCWNANGGALLVINNTPTYKIYNSTFANNHADWDGGAIASTTNGNIYNTIVANNTTKVVNPNCDSTLVGNNVIQFPAGGANCISGINGANPTLGALADNGGSTQTMAITVGSPAYGAGNAANCTPTDQRGVARKSPCDLGAYEQTTPATRTDTIGVYSNGVFYLRNSNTPGAADIVVPFGSPGNLPVVGDWNGDGVDTVGAYIVELGVFILRDSNTAGAPDHAFVMGNPGDEPIAGKWDATMTVSGIGVYRPSNGLLFARRTLTNGYADYTMVLGNPGDHGMAGDWDGNGYDSVGVFRPSKTQFYLANSMAGTTILPAVIYSDYNFVFGPANLTPVAGDWTGSGVSRVGYWLNGTFYLKNTFTPGVADTVFAFGLPGAMPVAGKWTNASVPPSSSPILSAGAGAKPPATPPTVVPGDSDGRFD